MSSPYLSHSPLYLSSIDLRMGDTETTDNPGWLHDAKLTREYVETLLQSVLDHKNGAVFIDVHHTLQGEALHGALILVHSLDQAKSSYVPLPLSTISKHRSRLTSDRSAFKAARDRLLARARSEVEVWRDEDLDLDPQFVEYTPQIELLGVDGRFQGQRVGQRLVSEAERYCVAEHAKPRRPWSTRYVDTILEEGFREDDLVVSLDTTWEPHTVSTVQRCQLCLIVSLVRTVIN